MNYKINFPNILKDIKIFYLVNEKKANAGCNLVYEAEYNVWYISDINKEDKFELPDLSAVSPEEYFQLSLVWDYPFPLEIALRIMQLHSEYSYNHNFKIIKNMLLLEGIVLP